MHLSRNVVTKKINLNLNYTLVKQQLTSGASRATYLFKTPLPLLMKHKKLLTHHKWFAGRSTKGSMIMWTRGKRTTKHKSPVVNYKFRRLELSFISGLLLMPFKNKLFSLVFLSSGIVTYVPTPTTHTLFSFNRSVSSLGAVNAGKTRSTSLNADLSITSLFFLLRQLPKNKKVSLLELIPLKGIQYARSTGTSAVILKMDSRLNTSLIKLPSGVKKVFSTFSLGSLGSVALPENKKKTDRRAGYNNKFGKKPHVRGVAMNPVDHPHGGRTKAIRYQRTPWGKTTKYK